MSSLRLNAPAHEESVAALLEAAGGWLPDEYLAFLRRANGGEGFIGDRYAILWPSESTIEFNRDYRAAEWAPGFCLIGSDGGGEAFAFNVSSGSGALYQLPFVGMEAKYAQVVARSFDLFLTGKTETAV